MNIPIEPQDLPKDQDEHHPNKDPRLLHVRSYSLYSREPVAAMSQRESVIMSYHIPNDADGVPGSQASKAYRESTR